MPSLDPGHSWIDVVVAVVLLLMVVAPTAITLITNRRVKTMKDDIKTNHGKKPFQYLEMVADIRETQVEMRMDQLSIKEAVAAQAEAQADLVQQLTDHTDQDAENFAELRSLITGSSN